jgi:flagellar motility protein MotE (MotC chaperone)
MFAEFKRKYFTEEKQRERELEEQEGDQYLTEQELNLKYGDDEIEIKINDTVDSLKDELKDLTFQFEVKSKEYEDLDKYRVELLEKINTLEKQIDEIFDYLKKGKKGDTLTQQQISVLNKIVRRISGNYKELSSSLNTYVTTLSRTVQTEEIKSNIVKAQDMIKKLTKGNIDYNEIETFITDIKNKYPAIKETSIWKIIIGTGGIILLISGIIIAIYKVVSSDKKDKGENIKKVYSTFENLSKKLQKHINELEEENKKSDTMPKQKKK